MNTTNEKKPIRNWLLLIILSYTTFIFNTTEFIPIGLLTDIAMDFHISESRASLLISVYAWFVAVMSLPLMIIIGKCDFRKILLIIIGCFVVSHLFSAISSNFIMLLISRLGVACSHAIFWSFISPLAIHIAPEEKKETAMSMIIAGTSLAMIVGMPLGRIIGLNLGWRYSFGCIGLAALIAFILLVVMLPSVPNKQETSLKSVPTVFKSYAIRGIYIFTFLVVIAHYIGYSYIEPFLRQIVGMTDNLTTLTLIIFGVAGIGASMLFSKWYDKNRRVFMLSISAGMASVLLLMLCAASNQYISIANCILWGMAFTAFNLVTEFEVIRHASRYTTIAVAIYSSIFNVGIGCGAFLGGVVLSDLSLSYIGYMGGTIAIIAFIFILKRQMSILGKT